MSHKETGAGRPKLSENGSTATFVRLPVDVRAAAQAEANAEGLTLSAFIRLLVCRAVRSNHIDPKGGKK